jgi:hypothetical protein
MTFSYELAADPISEILKDSASIIASIASGLCIGADRSIQERLRHLAGVPGGGPFLVKRPRVWLEVVGTNVKVHRREIQGLPSIDLEAVLLRNPEFESTLLDTIKRSGAADKASRMLKPFIGGGTVPTRQQYFGIRGWQPAFEHLAYRMGTVAAALLDLIRPQVLGESGTVYPSRLAAYWSGMTVLGQTMLLASDPEARPWLSEMAGQFVWTNWTPTFSLIRERTVWLAAIAARSAIAFGAPVIERYVDALSRAKVPMKAYDALFGLTAIALSDYQAAPAILKEIRRVLAADTLQSQYAARMYDDAIALISAIGEADRIDDRILHQLGWSPYSQRGFATKAAFTTIDPTRITHTGRLLGFAILPKLVAARVEDYYPVSSSRKRVLKVSNLAVSRIIARAWG